MKLIIIDLFCGAGGVTTGFEKAKDCKVIACINHDAVAIDSHKRNHPDVIHFVEDIKHIQMQQLTDIATKARKEYPDAALMVWASLECTNFSKAKGGLPRDADSRSLADYMPWYVNSLKPDYVGIENVMEFMSWGPLDDNGKPISKQAGTDYMRWVEEMKGLNDGYSYEWKQLNSADYGAYTSRKRFFGMFAHNGMPIVWPAPTHTKKPDGALFNKLQKWKPVRDVLDLEDKGNTIFGRKKPLSEKTLERVYVGLIKFVAGGKEAFFSKCFSSHNNTKVNSGSDIDAPAPTIPVRQVLGLVQTDFLSKYFSGEPESKNISLNDPAHTITNVDHHALLQCECFIQYNGKPAGSVFDSNGPCRTLCGKDRFQVFKPHFLIDFHGNSTVHSTNKPCPVLCSKDKLGPLQLRFIYRDFTNGGSTQSIEQPAGAVMPFPKMNIYNVEPLLLNANSSTAPLTDLSQPSPTLTQRTHFIFNPNWFNTNSTSVDQPCGTLIARMDKTPPYIVVTENGQLAVEVYETDSPFTVKIKEFMALYGIADITMRMLRVDELLRIQGFPNGYVLEGNQAKQKKFIGNSVVPIVITAWANALTKALKEDVACY